MSIFHLRLLTIAAISCLAVLGIAAVQAKPVWYAKTTLYASAGKHKDAFGYAVAIEKDTLVASAGSGTYVFERSGSTWIEQAKLLPNNIEEADANFGRSVAISGDTIAVAAPTAETNIDPGHINRTGAVYIFTRQGVSWKSWKQQAKLFPPKPKGGFHFGYNIALDHNTLVVGQDKEAHVFERDPATATWSYTTNLVIPKDVAGKAVSPTSLGTTVAVSGNTILVGGGRGVPNAAVGVLFERQPQTGTWTHKQEVLFPLPPKTYGSGGSLALDSNTLLLGVPLSAPFLFTGSAYIAKRSTADSDWQQTAKLTPRDAHRPGGLLGLLVDYGFGSRVALKGDYAVIAAVARQDGVVVRNSYGEVFLFHRQPKSEKWTQLAKLSPHSTRREFLPTVSISDRYVVVGDRTALNPQGELTGAVHLFELPTTAR